MLFLVPTALEATTLQRFGLSGIFNTTQQQPTRRLLQADSLVDAATGSHRRLLQTNATANATAANTTANSTAAGNGTTASTSNATATSFVLPPPYWTYFSDYSTEATPDPTSLDVPPLPPSYTTNLTLQPDLGNPLQDQLANTSGVVAFQGD